VIDPTAILPGDSGLEALRFVVDGWATGARNMAVDEGLAIGAAHRGGKATLRVYRFQPACITIGRFQRYPGELDPETCMREEIEIVRRPTGGLAILHLDEFTYSLTLPVSTRTARSRESVFRIAASGIVEALRLVGVEAGIVVHEEPGHSATWCFDRAFGVDLEWNGRKICGSAQKIGPGYALQHGSIFLKPNSQTLRLLVGAGSGEPRPSEGGQEPVALEEAAAEPISWERMCGAFEAGFSNALGVKVVRGVLTGDEEETVEKFFERRYSNTAWLQQVSD
jgi:lipoate-protein ligase A